MQLLVDGNATINKKKFIGGIVLDAESLIFYHRTGQTGAAAGASTGGLIGLLIGSAVDKAREKKHADEKKLEQEPYFAALSEDVQKKLKGIRVYDKVDKNQIADIRETRTGYAFTTLDGREFAVRVGMKKKKIREYLQQTGYNVPVK